MAAPSVVLAIAIAWAAGANADPANQAAQQGPEARIAFADKDIFSWQVIDNRTVLIETNGHKWYKARLMSPCIDLPFSERIGFESNSDGSFDKFSAIQTRGTRCPLSSLIATEPPLKAAKKPGAPAASAAKP